MFTVKIRANQHFPFSLQTRFLDHIIRHTNEMNRIAGTLKQMRCVGNRMNSIVENPPPKKFQSVTKSALQQHHYNKTLQNCC